MRDAEFELLVNSHEREIPAIPASALLGLSGEEFIIIIPLPLNNNRRVNGKCRIYRSVSDALDSLPDLVSNRQAAVATGTDGRENSLLVRLLHNAKFR